MSCKTVRHFVSILILILSTGLTVSAQERITYHIGAAGTTPGGATSFLYLMQGPDDAAQGLYESTGGYLGYGQTYHTVTTIRFYKDDDSMYNSMGDYYYYGSPFQVYNPWYEKSATLILESDTEGVPRIITGNDTRLFYVYDYSSYEQRMELIIRPDIQISGNYTGESTSYGFAGGGGISMEHAHLTAKQVLFSNNYNYDSYSSESGGAISAYSYASEYYGESLVDVERARFLNNESGYNGGAISSYYTTIFADRAVFDNNIAGAKTYSNSSYGYGGAIYATNSDVSVKGANFRGNKALSYDWGMGYHYGGYGGAIYFGSSYDSQRYTLTLGAYEGESAEFIGNTHQAGTGTDTPNSIVLSGGAGSQIDVVIDTEKGGTLNMQDPMATTSSSSRYELNISKIGEGTWILGGENRLNTVGGTKFNVDAGNFRLADGASVDLVEDYYLTSGDRFSVASGAIVLVGDNSTGNEVRISTTNLQVAPGGRITINGSLNLNIVDQGNGDDNQSLYAGSLRGTGDLHKTGNGTLTFSGQTDGYGGNLIVEEGIFQVDGSTRFETAGQFNLESGAELAVMLNATGNADTAKIKAGGMTLAPDAVVRISGVGDVAGTEYLILQSGTKIEGIPDFQSPESGRVDYMDVSFWQNEAETEWWAKVSLNWFAVEKEKATGTFTIVDPVYFNVGVELSDQTRWETERPDSNWNGKDLTKKGVGTLELSVENTYSGKTKVENGTLLVTHSKGLGTGTDAIEVGNGAKLALNFKDKQNAEFDRQVADLVGSMGGQLVKQGDGTILLTGTQANTHSGGTILEGGILAIRRQDQLGTGQVIFSGGTLRNVTEIKDFDRRIEMTDGNDVRFDTAENLTVFSKIQGKGGLVKSGDAVLTLRGAASYEGDTSIKAGTLQVDFMSYLGKGDIVISDGARFRNTSQMVNDRNFIVQNGGGTRGAIVETPENMTISGVVSGSGVLAKAGEGTLTLSGENVHSGGTRIDEGALVISKATNLGTGAVFFNGGRLQVTDTISQLSNPVLTLNDNSADFLIDPNKSLVLTSAISGNGGLDKRGAGSLYLEKANTYTGTTRIHKGTLYVNGRIESATIVDENGTLAGSGTISNNVRFEGGTYQWYCGRTVADSPYLTVSGNVFLKDAVFRPITATDLENATEPVDGRTVLRYLGKLDGDKEFLYVDNSASPIYEFTLDYGTRGEVRVLSHLRDQGLGLSDSVAVGLMMSQRRAHRRAFDRIDQSLREVRDRNLQPIRLGKYRGQEASTAHHIWGDLYGRTTRFQSTYHRRNWKLNSFGFQAGYSFVATNDLDWGITGGVELPELRNSGDEIDATDGFLGLYYGRRVQRMWEIKGYVGGGTQRYKSWRSEGWYKYRSRYYGESFQTNIELARPFRLGSALNFVIRPYFAFDLEYASQQSSVEDRISSEYRTYSNGSLTQLYARVGIDVERRSVYGDFYAGVSYSNMISGNSTPKIDIYYPTASVGGTVRGAELGQNIFTLRIGGNRYLDEAGKHNLYLNLTSDIYADREGGQAEFTGSIGYGYRF